MLVIGHRGAPSIAPENTIESIQAAIDAGVDMVELDLRLTRDNKLVLLHDINLMRIHGSKRFVSTLTLDELNAITQDHPVTMLTSVLEQFFGKILLNFELKSRGSGEQLVRLLKKQYIKKSSDWDNVLISSLKASELLKVRKLSQYANIALVHRQNPFLFIAYHRFITFTAVGFHRLYINPLALEIAKKAHIFTYTYTVNRVGALRSLEEHGIDGVVTNYPDKFVQELKRASVAAKE